MRKIILIGLTNIRSLREELLREKSETGVLKIHRRLITMMSSVIDDLLRDYGEREGEGRNKKED